ncbi:UDP-glucose:undecaprenyl-phosphate glucose-1-phosphate transferase [Pseudoalteromonas sp. P1-26]|uniref:undecaprenyl-phosphate glucose phosphotransferase n=1 Tax=Pseudoalteromonas sp. P1-26 TaxID=1723759 RepID=UPI0006D653A6|nr:undecaprenyl-phosphate glucose phosphotransferase [Pseudoalteromonas sp. P1-26]KPZ67184.1 UDP-glucose:undecaprenyl-phosphate glucose-1-phosphate transferase [Pseudoalteromonas sp. P1-26]
MPHKNSGILQSNATIVAFIQRILDISIIVGCLWGTVALQGLPWLLQHTTAALLSVFLFHFTSELDKLYISWRGLSIYKELKKTISHWFVSAAILFLSVNFLAPQYLNPEGLQFYWFVSVLVSLCVYRVVLRLILRGLRSQGINTRSVVIAGAGTLGQQLANNIIANSSFGLVFGGYYDDAAPKQKLVAAQTIGNLEQLVADCKEGGIDRVYIVLPPQAYERRKWLVKELADSTASVYIVPDVFTYQLLHSRSDTIMGIPTISIYDSPLDGSNAIIKRIEDIILSTLILIMISPVLLGLALAVKFTSKGPVFFKQNRYGIDGKPIKVWKFRSMNVMEDGAKVTQATKNDSRFTPIGQFIRKTSLDELPQFINVLQGQMSIVGPRPHAVAHNEEYRKLVDGYMLRHKVKPGITGWAQINGWRGETDTLDKMEKRIEFDLEYIRNWSLFFDLKIVFLTIFKGFVNKNAY